MILKFLHDQKEKIFYHYYPSLKVGGLFIFDDISWLPYLKNKKRNNFNCEINNEEIFNKILQIKSENENHFDLYFSFKGSGSAKIVKTSEDTLRRSMAIKSRKYSFKNKVRKIFNLFK